MVNGFKNWSNESKAGALQSMHKSSECSSSRVEPGLTFLMCHQRHAFWTLQQCNQIKMLCMDDILALKEMLFKKNNKNSFITNFRRKTIQYVRGKGKHLLLCELYVTFIFGNADEHKTNSASFPMKLLFFPQFLTRDNSKKCF